MNLNRSNDLSVAGNAFADDGGRIAKPISPGLSFELTHRVSGLSRPIIVLLAHPDADPPQRLLHQLHSCRAPFS